MLLKLLYIIEMFQSKHSSSRILRMIAKISKKIYRPPQVQEMQKTKSRNQPITHWHQFWKKMNQWPPINIMLILIVFLQNLVLRLQISWWMFVNTHLLGRWHQKMMNQQLKSYRHLNNMTIFMWINLITE